MYDEREADGKRCVEERGEAAVRAYGATGGGVWSAERRREWLRLGAGMKRRMGVARASGAQREALPHGGESACSARKIWKPKNFAHCAALGRARIRSRNLRRPAADAHWARSAGGVCAISSAQNLTRFR